MNQNFSLQTKLEVPPELLAPAPRKVVLTDDGKSGLIIIRILIGISAILCLWFCQSEARKALASSALRQNGTEAQGTITKFDHVHRGPDVVHYTFVASGKKFSGKSEVPPETESDLENASVISIRYLPENPINNHPATWEWSIGSDWLAVVLIFIPAIIGVSGYTVIVKERSLMMYGSPVVAIVTDCRTKSRGSIRVSYKFETENGVTLNGADSSRNEKEVGAPVLILYLQARPERNLIYPGYSFNFDTD